MSREQLAAEHGMIMEYVNWFFDNKKEGCGNVWFMMMAAMWEGWQAASKASEQQLAAVVAENAALKESRKNLTEFIHDELNGDYPLNMDVETPATDAAIANIQAQGVEMYADMLELGADGAESEGFEDDSVRFFRDEAEIVREFAAQLRQGEKQ